MFDFDKGMEELSRLYCANRVGLPAGYITLRMLLAAICKFKNGYVKNVINISNSTKQYDGAAIHPVPTGFAYLR